LLATDLHAGNVLASARRPWLVIDPKPHAGDPAYDLTQHLMNVKTRIADDGTALIGPLLALAGVHADRLLGWTLPVCAWTPTISNSPEHSIESEINRGFQPATWMDSTDRGWLIDLDEISAGVRQHGQRQLTRLGGRHGELHAELAEPLSIVARLERQHSALRIPCARARQYDRGGRWNDGQEAP
jgi:hypothetical protein